MSTLDEFRDAIDLVLGELRAAPARLVRRFRDMHSPGDDAHCWRCGEPWPCTEWVRLDADATSLDEGAP